MTNRETIFKKCSNEECEETLPDHAWGHIKAEGWFLQKSGEAWCPQHIPEWVNNWRSRRDSKAARLGHPRYRTPYQKRKFEERWDKRVEEGWARNGKPPESTHKGGYKQASILGTRRSNA